jgi:hypothetical protein
MLFVCTVRTYLGLLLPTIHTCNQIIYVPQLYGRVTSILASTWPRTYLALALASNLSGLGLCLGLELVCLGLGLECGVLEPIPGSRPIHINCGYPQ